MIVYVGGPEGAGKTALMTRYARIHHLMGGEIWSFPGYELLNNRGRVISKTIMPHKVMSLLDEMQYILLLIDEIQNFMNHHAWYFKIIDIMTYGALAQRRKREFAIMATGPIFEWLPPDLRMMFHEVIYCADRHWKDKSIPRGEQIIFTREDKRGVLSGRIGTRTLPKIFRPKDYFKYYNTFSLVDPRYQFNNIRIQTDEILMDQNGNIIEEKIPEPDYTVLNRFVENEKGKQEDQLVTNIIGFTKQLAERGITRIPRDIVWQYFRAVDNKQLKNSIGKILKSYGAKSIDRTKQYDFSELSFSRG